MSYKYNTIHRPRYWKIVVDRFGKIIPSPEGYTFLPFANCPVQKMVARSKIEIYETIFYILRDDGLV